MINHQPQSLDQVVPGPPAIRYRNVSKSYSGTLQPAVHDVSIDIAPGEFIVLLGPSGCGKTTLLKMTNRLIGVSSGTIEVNGRDVARVKVTSLRRGIGYVIQQVGLFPHVTVAGNVETIPKLLGWTKQRRSERINELLNLVGLDPRQYRDRYPAQLSGGQQQRVGLARALAADPPILLMDEPFGAIDAITRTRLQDELIAIQRRLRKTVVFVTHDVEEALRLADRLVVMNEGSVVQYDTPLAILTKPANDFIRTLLNTDDVLREFSVIRVETVMLPLLRADPPQSVPVGHTVRDAVSRMLAASVNELGVVDSNGIAMGVLTLDRIRELGARVREDETAVVP